MVLLLSLLVLCVMPYLPNYEQYPAAANCRVALHLVLPTFAFAKKKSYLVKFALLCIKIHIFFFVQTHIRWLHSVFMKNSISKLISQNLSAGLRITVVPISLQAF